MSRKLKSPSVFVASVCLLVAGAMKLSAAPKPNIRFEARAIVAQGIAAHGSVLLLGIAHEPQPYALRTREYALALHDDDGDGVVRLTLKGEVPSESVWVVVDMSSGEYSVAEPGNGKLHIKPLKAPQLVRRGSDRSAKVVADSEFVKFWIVRPGVGAWIRTVEDGGRGDADQGGDGKAAGRLDEFEPIGRAPAAPTDFQRDDIILAIDPVNLALAEVKLRD